jgi:hypothetical protein
MVIESAEKIKGELMKSLHVETTVLGCSAEAEVGTSIAAFFV